MGRGGGGGGGGGRGKRAGGAGAGGAGEYKEAPTWTGPGAATDVLETRSDPYGQVTVTREIAEAERRALKDEGLQKLEAYKDLPPVENANRVVVDGLVHVGDKGAPIVKPKLTNEQAMQRFTDMGVPMGDAYRNLSTSGDAAALVELLPPGSKFLGAGVEGIGFAIPGPGHKVLRIQHGGGLPLNMPDVGPVGAYPQWVGKYGNTYAEMKEGMAMQFAFVGEGQGRVNTFATDVTWRDIQKNMETTMKRAGKDVVSVDDHEYNLAIDYFGRGRVIDAGAYRPPNNRVAVAVWGGGNRVPQHFTYRNLAE